MSAERVVLVVGATSGIGLAVARRLAERGDRVGVCARDSDRVAEVAASLPGAVPVPGDLTDAVSVRAAVDRLLAACGRIDAVVLTAQTMAYGTVEQVPEAVFATVVDTAVTGLHRVAQSVLPLFRAHGGGHLVVVNSLLAEIAVPSMSSYCAAKWGQLGLARSLQLEVRRDPRVHVSLVLPGAVDTPIYDQAASYAGRQGHAPPPVVAPDRVARACVDVLDRPRRLVHVGPANRLAVAGYRLLPGVYDRLAVPLVRRVVLRGVPVVSHPGNVQQPRPDREAERGGWRWWGGRRR